MVAAIDDKMSSPPEVSVIIPTFNRKNVLAETLNRISSQSFPPDKYEVIVIDDGSGDGTREFLRELKLPVAFKYLLNERNLGRAKTRNRGIEAARGKYILMLDDDIWADKDLVKNHYRRHQRQSEAVAVVGAILVSEDVPKSVVNMYLSRHHLWCFEQMCRFADSLPYGFCKTASLSLPRKLIEQAGRFNEQFIKYGGEDSEFGYRLSQRGIRMVFAREVVGYHYHEESVQSLMNRFICLGESYSQFVKVHPEISASEFKGFFTSNYHQGISPRSIAYNIIKLLMFNPPARLLNKSVLNLVNGRANPVYVKYLIPVFKMQWYRYGMTKKENDNRN
jgi:glycosyltransferase involved in cell wall biosynthesis